MVKNPRGSCAADVFHASLCGMTEVRFYHLQRKTLEQALPEILGKASERGFRAVVMLGSAVRVEAINALLWTFDPNSFLPHGSKKNGHAKDQPIWLTTEDENPNAANLLVLADGATSGNVGGYDLCCEIFDGSDEQMLATARERWKAYKEQEFELSYFQQDDSGKWQKQKSA